MATVVGVFETREQAQNAYTALREGGIPESDISVVARSEEDKSRLVKDSEIGAGIGALGGLLVSLAAVTVPGVGPVLVAGPLLAALGGAGVGALAGGLIAALTEAGVPESEAPNYAESVRRGDIVITVEASGEEAEKVRRILAEYGAVDMGERVANWRERGWSGHNPGAEPMSEDEIRRERANYGKTASPAYEWENMNEKERSHAGHHEGHEAAEDESWPHDKAHDIGESLVDSAPNVAKPKS